MAFRDLATRDLSWKLFSLGLATVLWFTVQAVRQESLSPPDQSDAWETRTFANLPVHLVSASADVREFRANPSTVQATVAGRPEIMAVLQPGEIHVTVDLGNSDAEENTGRRVEVSPPAGVALVRVLPQEVNIITPPNRGK
jgi:hypothetical protein